VDSAFVLGHAWAAGRRHLLTDLVVSVVLLIALLSATAKSVAVVFGLCAAVASWRLLQDLRRRDTAAALYHGVVAVFSWIVCLGPILFRSVENYFSGPQPYAQAHLSGLQFVLVLVLVLWAVLFASRVAGQRGVARALDGQHDPQPAGWHRDRLAHLARTGRGNVTVYSPQATDGPFVGAGTPLTAWTMTVPLVRPDGPLVDLREGQRRLDVTTLYAAARAALQALADPAEPADRAELPGRPLTGLVVQERLYVSGRLPAGHPLLDRGLPVPEVPLGILREVAAAGRGSERYYLGVRTAKPDAGACLGCFVYLNLIGGILFVEFVQTAVAAVRADFRSTAGVGDRAATSVLSALVAALVDVVTAAPIAPIETARRAAGGVRRQLRQRLAERSERLRGQYDYGARTGLRELAADPGHRVVDQLDVNEYARVVERCLLDTLARCLSEHGFDPAALQGQPDGPGGRTVVTLPGRAVGLEQVRPA
jgi:hypothetical protein